MHTPRPSKCRQFRQTRVLIVGCGDVGVRAARALLPRCRVLALTSSPGKVAPLRALGVLPLQGNLDDRRSLARLSALAPYVLHLAPPPSSGPRDPRTRALLTALAQRGQVRALVYGSTSGVYGDAGGAFFDETRTVAPATDRARRRVDAESQVRGWGRRSAVAVGARASILRIPGIYALDRDGGDPRDRVRRGNPLLHRPEDVYTNHIHADDLARACVVALWRGRAQRVVHVCDDSDMLMGDYFDLVAQLSGLPTLPRMSRDEAAAVLSPMQRSFMGESRRLSNQRLKQELRLRLAYPDIRSAWPADVSSVSAVSTGKSPLQGGL